MELLGEEEGDEGAEAILGVTALGPVPVAPAARARPDFRGTKSRAGNLEQETSSRKPRAGNLEQETDSALKQRASSIEHRAQIRFAGLARLRQASLPC